jgi:light-regulated signal transduction histidine kinase (bacteriophytochrome)/HAMP domain-containing protein
VLKRNIGIIIVVLFLSSLVAFFVSSRLQTVISKPILSLAKVAKAVSEEKDYSTRAIKHSNDEVGLLIDAFNEMLGQIQQRNVELVDAKEKLEVRVEERTAELTSANEQLTQEIVVRKRAEEMTKRLNNDLESTIAKLDRANGELKDFVYIASHDLREPLRKISAFGELLSTSLKDKLNDDEKENFGFMVDGAKRMQQMIDALLAYSRVATKGVDFEAVDLNKVVEELREVELAVKIEESGAKILVPEQLHTVSSDPAQVRQLMQNLVANGLKYQKKGAVPQITIRSSAADNDMVRVEVTDNGIGIKQEYFKNLFIMFRRLHSRQEYEGSGIGLAVCKKIVERHGGNIGVSSTCGEGSTFWFTMPAQKPSEEKQAQLVLSGEAGVREQQDS